VDETAFKKLISGRRRGLLPALQRAGLSVLSCCYGLAVRLRNFAFDVELKKTQRAAVPVISVGNITAGGTGKTPFVAFLTDWFNSRGVKVALLSRGDRPFSQTPGADSVGSPDDKTNDEKLVLDRLCPGVPHLQQRDRVAAAKIAVADHGAELLILDDGFQHRRLGRDLDIVLIDALNPFGYGRLLPRGLLREPLSGLRRADLIVLTRADQCADAEKLRILASIRRNAPDCEIIEVAFRPDGLVNSTGDTATLASLTDKPVVAFCGIGNPESFRRTLAACECDVREFRVFPDHHHYSETDVEEIAALAGRHDAAAVVATLKDLVKIDQRKINAVSFWAVRISTDVLSGADILAARLARFAPAKNPASSKR